jgi:hypothetical protein
MRVRVLRAVKQSLAASPFQCVRGTPQCPSLHASLTHWMMRSTLPDVSATYICGLFFD